MEKQQNIHNIWVRESRESENFSWEKSRGFLASERTMGCKREIERAAKQPRRRKAGFGCCCCGRLHWVWAAAASDHRGCGAVCVRGIDRSRCALIRTGACKERFSKEGLRRDLGNVQHINQTGFLSIFFYKIGRFCAFIFIDLKYVQISMFVFLVKP